MLDTTLEILDAQGQLLAISNTANLSESLTVTLSAGDYYIGVLSAADPNQLGFYDMGSYFLYGSIVPVPEPSSWTLLVCGSVALACAARRRASRAVIALIRSRLAAFGSAGC